MAELIQFKNITKQFKKRVILENINLDIRKGEIFGIIGMSGSGKSTLLNTLIAFLEPEEGDVLFFSEKDKKYKSIYQNQAELRKKFGFATQAASFYPKLTVEENLLYFGALYGLPKKTRINNAKHLLELTGLISAKDRLAQELSGGMEKKLGIACALIHNPEVLILDEPTADLDPLSRIETWNLIKGIHKTDTTIIIASHFISELEPICDRIGILNNKKIIAVDTPSKLKARYRKSSLVDVFKSLKKE